MPLVFEQTTWLLSLNARSSGPKTVWERSSRLFLSVEPVDRRVFTVEKDERGGHLVLRLHFFSEPPFPADFVPIDAPPRTSDPAICSIAAPSLPTLAAIPP